MKYVVCSSSSVSLYMRRAEFCFFDGRHTEAAIAIASCIGAGTTALKKKKKKKKKSHESGGGERDEDRPFVVVEAERVRDNLSSLLSCADGVVTSTTYPTDATGEDCLGDAMEVMMLEHVPNARWLITTLGGEGSVAVERCSRTTCSSCDDDDGDDESDDSDHETAPFVSLHDEIEELRLSLCHAHEQARWSCNDHGDIKTIDNTGSLLTNGGLYTNAGDFISAAPVVSSSRPFRLHRHSKQRCAAGYVAPRFLVHYAAAASLPSSCAVLDTTGAGDAYIGALLTWLLHEARHRTHHDDDDSRHGSGLCVGMAFAAVVAAANCTSLGARQGLPVLSF